MLRPTVVVQVMGYIRCRFCSCLGLTCGRTADRVQPRFFVRALVFIACWGSWSLDESSVIVIDRAYAHSSISLLFSYLLLFLMQYHAIPYHTISYRAIPYNTNVYIRTIPFAGQSKQHLSKGKIPNQVYIYLIRLSQNQGHT